MMIAPSLVFGGEKDIQFRLTKIRSRQDLSNEVFASSDQGSKFPVLALARERPKECFLKYQSDTTGEISAPVLIVVAERLVL